MHVEDTFAVLNPSFEVSLQYTLYGPALQSHDKIWGLGARSAEDVQLAIAGQGKSLPTNQPSDGANESAGETDSWRKHNLMKFLN